MANTGYVHQQWTFISSTYVQLTSMFWWPTGQFAYPLATPVTFGGSYLRYTGWINRVNKSRVLGCRGINVNQNKSGSRGHTLVSMQLIVEESACNQQMDGSLCAVNSRLSVIFAFWLEHGDIGLSGGFVIHCNNLYIVMSRGSFYCFVDQTHSSCPLSIVWIQHDPSLRKRMNTGAEIS